MDQPDRGLCDRCQHAQLLGNTRGSQFLRCGRAAAEPGYHRYPPIPVHVCPGFERSTETDSAATPGGSPDASNYPTPDASKQDDE